VSLLSGRRMDPGRYETLLVHGSLPPGEQSMAAMARLEETRTEYIPALVQPVRPDKDCLALANLIALMRRFRPNIVHTHTAKAGFIGRLAALAVRPRPLIVHTFHGHVLEGYFGPPVNFTYRRLERALGIHSDALIGVSQATVDDLVRLRVAPRNRFRVIPLGLDLAPFTELEERERRDLRRELGLQKDDVLVTYVGRVVPIKRLDVLLRGVARARRDKAPLYLAIVGDGEIRPDLEALARELRIEDAVRFLGYRRDLTRIAAAADIAALTSDNEGTPVSLIEAGAAGKPAVASAVGGVPEVVTAETGVLFPPGDVEALAEGLVSLADAPDRRIGMGAGARARVLERYSASRLIADMDTLYSELLSDGSRSPKPPRAS
jgi:glycosyltransferase involved in cell wall biosynthesis